MLAAEGILRKLAEHDVRYVLIGALAATFHGSPLRTDDVDICPDPTESNLERLGRALMELGAEEWDPHKGDPVPRNFDAEMLALDKTWILWTDQGRLDLVYEPAGTGGYKDLAAHAIVFEIDDLAVTVASLEDVIRSKEAAGREKDHSQLPTLRRLLELRQEKR